MAEIRFLGLNNLDKQIKNRQKLARIKRAVNEKGLVKQMGDIERLALTEMHFNDHTIRRLKDDLFSIHIHTKTVSEQRHVLDRFLDKFEREINANPPPAIPMLSSEPTNSFADQQQHPGQVSQSYSEKRLRCILPSLVKHREQLLSSTLLRLDSEHKLPRLVARKKRPRPFSRAMVVVRQSGSGAEPPNERETPISPMLAVVAVANDGAGAMNNRHHVKQPLGRTVSDAKSVKSVKSVKSGADAGASRGDVHASKAGPPKNVFDTIASGADVSEEERERLHRINMLRMMAGMTAMPTAATNWNKQEPPASKEHQRSRTAETPGCPDLKDPLPFDLPKLRLKKKEKNRLSRPVPLAAKMIQARFHIQSKKIEDAYLNSWKERVISEDKWRLIDMRRQQEQEKAGKTTDQLIAAQVAAKQQQQQQQQQQRGGARAVSDGNSSSGRDRGSPSAGGGGGGDVDETIAEDGEDR